MSTAKVPVFHEKSEAARATKNKSPKHAKSTGLKNRPAALHNYHPIHHTLTTKTPPLQTVFLKNPLKNTLPPQTKKRQKLHPIRLQRNRNLLHNLNPKT